MLKKLTVKFPVNPEDTAKQRRFIANKRPPGRGRYSWCADLTGDELELYHPKTHDLLATVEFTLCRRN